MDKNKYPSLWRIVFYALGLGRFIRRIDLIKWLFFHNLRPFLQGCEKDPVPINLWKRLLWYKKRVFFLVRFYRLMSKYDDEKEGEKGNK